jgi:NAD(P)-dependent dehydrogenase (short-subunit alcohol dehydrogenase family)
MPEHFVGKVALVTGGSSGIGRATAVAFAREGAKVVIGDILVESGQETVRLVEQTGAEAIFTKADVSSAADVEALVNEAVEKYGHLDFAFNNAGIRGMEATTTECTEENWNQTIDINLEGVWLCMKYEIPQMLKHGGGAIVNTSSVIGLVGMRNGPAYAASKHGVVGLTKAAALEYAEMGIRINAVCPGFIRTAMTEPAIIATAQGRAKRPLPKMPIGRIGTPEEVAEAVLWLCSDAASFVTGHIMAVDGGWVAQ